MNLVKAVLDHVKIDEENDATAHPDGQKAVVQFNPDSLKVQPEQPARRQGRPGHAGHPVRGLRAPAS